jgi:hypothetical protein
MKVKSLKLFNEFPITYLQNAIFKTNPDENEFVNYAFVL